MPHLRIWRRDIPLIVFCVAGASAGVVRRSWWSVALLVAAPFLFRGFFIGLLNVVVVRRQQMDIIVEQNGLGFLAGNERWYFALDGLTAFDELAPGLWTVQHWNGSVVNIPAELLSAEQVEFFRNWVTRANAIRRGPGIGPPTAA